MPKSVYFIRCDLTQAVKIGISDDPLARLRQLQTGSPGKLVLIGAIPGDRAVEVQLHRRFAGVALEGEWFRLSEDDIRSIMESDYFETCQESQGAPFCVDDDDEPWVTADRCGFHPMIAWSDGLPSFMNRGVLYFKLADVIAWHEKNTSPWDAQTLNAARGVLGKFRRGEMLVPPKGATF